MHILTFGTGYGPFKCQCGADCDKAAYSVILSDDEYHTLQMHDDTSASAIIETRVGKYICKTHLKKLKQEEVNI